MVHVELPALRFISHARNNQVANQIKADIERQARPAGSVENDPASGALN
jgi:hypothetical protein